MRKYLLALSAAAGVLAATPSIAQSNANRYNGSEGISNRISQLETRLQEGIANGSVDRREARDIRQRLREVTRLETRYSRDGLTQTERRDLQQRLRDTRVALRAADGGNARFAENDDEYFDRYTRGASSSFYPEVNEVCATQTGLSSVLSRVFGSDNCLRVGERASTATLSSVPSRYSDQFRDTGNTTHRYVEGKIVQMDRRTGEVTRIYDVER